MQEIPVELPTVKLPSSKLDLAKGILEKTLTVPRDEYFGALKIGAVEPRLLSSVCYQVCDDNLTLQTATLEHVQNMHETKDKNMKMIQAIKRVAIMPNTILFSSVFRNVTDRCHICGDSESLCELLTIVYCPERFVFGPTSTLIVDPNSKDCINYEVEDVRYCSPCRSIYELDSAFYFNVNQLNALANWISYLVFVMAQVDHNILKIESPYLMSGWRNDVRIYKYQKATLTPDGLRWSEIEIAFSYVIVDSDHRSLRKTLVFHSQEEARKYIDDPIYIDTVKFTEQVKSLGGPKPLKQNWEGFLKKAHIDSYYFAKFVGGVNERVDKVEKSTKDEQPIHAEQITKDEKPTKAKKSKRSKKSKKN